MTMESEYLGEKFIAFYPRLAALICSADRALILTELAKTIALFDSVDDQFADHPTIREGDLIWFNTTHSELQQKLFPWLTVYEVTSHITFLYRAKILRLRWPGRVGEPRQMWVAIDHKFLNDKLGWFVEGGAQ